MRLRKRMKTLILSFLILACTASITAAAFDHGAWGQLLRRHVVPATDASGTSVNYAGLQGDKDALQHYLAQLAAVTEADFLRWPSAERLAFLINAYNAWTVQLVLSEYPEITSIKEIGGWFGSPWDKAIAPLLGRTRTLDEIEHQMIRGSGQFDEPRIHFAVNCASVGCPALRPEAYTADHLEDQLEDQTTAFLRDRSRNAWRDDRLHVSPIFKWYRADFHSGWRGHDSLSAFLASYASALDLTPAQKKKLAAGDVRIHFSTYDWTLNDSDRD